jgi:hypothetical protein
MLGLKYGTILSTFPRHVARATCVLEPERTMDAGKAAAVENAAQQFTKREIVKSAFIDGQSGENDRALWKIDGCGGAGNGKGMGPFVIAYSCIVHNPSADADDPTLPVDALIFENDIHKDRLHYQDAAVAAATVPDDDRDNKEENDEEEDDHKNRDTDTENHKKAKDCDLADSLSFLVLFTSFIFRRALAPFTELVVALSMQA